MTGLILEAQLNLFHINSLFKDQLKEKIEKQNRNYETRKFLLEKIAQERRKFKCSRIFSKTRTS